MGHQWPVVVRELTAGQGEDDTIGCLLHYDYIKNHYRLIAIDLSMQKELDADPKANEQIEFGGKSKKINDDDGAETNFILTILERIK